MPYLNKIIANVKDKKAYEVLTDYGFSMKKAQRSIDKKLLFCNEELVEKKNELLNGSVSLLSYEVEPKALKPLYENEDFAVFSKPSGVLSHPNGRNCSYSLYDELWSLYSREACVVHRLDKETSGLILVAKNKNSLRELKGIFERREIKKSYLALVEGQIFEDFEVKAGISPSDGEIKIAMMINDEGKQAYTKFQVLQTFEDKSLVKCFPLTGRQHQLRLHLFHVGHRILGDPLYGLSLENFEAILDEKLSEDERIQVSKAKRLCLHASELSFTFKGNSYYFSSNYDFLSEQLF